MKKFIIFILTIHILSAAYSQLPLRSLAKGVHAVYGDNALIRNAPNTQGKIKHILPIGTMVDVIQKSSAAEKLNNVDDYWYKVVYDLDTGYIWGALISDIFLEDDLDGDSISEIFLAYCNTFYNGTDYKYMVENSRIEFRVARNNKKISEFRFRTENQYLFDSVCLKTFGQFTPPFTAICISDTFISGCWGNGELYFRLNNDTLDSLFNFTAYCGEGGIVQYGKFILPDDSLGKPNTLIIEAKTGSVADATYLNRPVEWKYYRTFYMWDGRKFIWIKTE